jgi:hypothetical protein
MQNVTFDETFDALQDKHYTIHGYKLKGSEFDTNLDTLKWTSKRRYSRVGVNQFIFRWMRTAKKTRKQIDYFNIDPPMAASDDDEAIQKLFENTNTLVERE